MSAVGSDYDVVVIGGGHNGLVAAGYLAGAGLRVLVLERQPRLGGPGGRREFLPGYHTSVTNSPGSLEPKVVRDLELAEHGLSFVRPDPTLVQPLEDALPFVGFRDRGRTAQQLNAYSPGESQRYDDLFAYAQRFADRLGISLFREPPTLAELVANLDDLDAEEAFSRLVLGSGTDLSRYFLRSAAAQTIVATLSTAVGPHSPSLPGTAFNLMMRPLSLASSQAEAGYDPRTMVLRGSTGLPVGGIGAVIDAMESSLRARGGEVRTGVGVDRIVPGEHGHRVVTADGTEVTAPVVISAVGPRQTVSGLMRDDPAWAPFRDKLVESSFPDGSCKVVLAIEGLPAWAGAEGLADQAALCAAQFRISPSIDYLEESYGECLLGRVPANPVIWGLIPSVTSPGLAPAGRHVVSMNIIVPRRLRGRCWDEARQEAIDNSVRAMARWMPDLPSRIVDATCVTPEDFEGEYGLEDAHICHLPGLPGQQFWMRPVPGLHDYRTPTPGLYLSGNGVWPGNTFSGLAGHNTSQAILHDLKDGLLTIP